MFLAILGHSPRRVLNSLLVMAKIVESFATRTVAPRGSLRITALSPTTAPGATQAISSPSRYTRSFPLTNRRTSFPKAPSLIRTLPSLTSILVLSLLSTSSSEILALSANAKLRYWW